MKFRDKCFAFRWVFAELNKYIRKSNQSHEVVTPKTFGDLSFKHQLRMEATINRIIANPHYGGLHSGRKGAMLSLYSL